MYCVCEYDGLKVVSLCGAHAHYAREVENGLRTDLKSTSKLLANSVSKHGRAELANKYLTDEIREIREFKSEEFEAFQLEVEELESEVEDLEIEVDALEDEVAVLAEALHNTEEDRMLLLQQRNSAMSVASSAMSVAALKEELEESHIFRESYRKGVFLAGYKAGDTVDYPFGGPNVYRSMALNAYENWKKD